MDSVTHETDMPRPCGQVLALILPVTMHMPVQVLRPLVLLLGSLAPPACKARVLTALSDMLVRWIRRAPLPRGGGSRPVTCL